MKIYEMGLLPDAPGRGIALKRGIGVNVVMYRGLGVRQDRLLNRGIDMMYRDPGVHRGRLLNLLKAEDGPAGGDRGIWSKVLSLVNIDWI